MKRILNSLRKLPPDNYMLRIDKDTGNKSLLKAKGTMRRKKNKFTAYTTDSCAPYKQERKTNTQVSIEWRRWCITLNCVLGVNPLCHRQTLESGHGRREMLTFISGDLHALSLDRYVAAKDELKTQSTCLAKQSAYAKPVIKLLTGFHLTYLPCNVPYHARTKIEVVCASSMNDLLPLATPCVIHGLLWQSKGFFSRSGVDINTMDDWQAA